MLATRDDTVAALARGIRRIILQQSRRANVGHIGSALSIADLVAVLYGGILRVSDPDDPERDRFVLSKGHAALALYAALHLKGWLSAEELNTFCADGSLLGVHPDHRARGVDFSTGSLGQGLSMAAGSALAARFRGSPRRVFALLSDAECNEGAVWEAAAFAAHHRLSSLIALIDENGQQALGSTAEILDMSPLSEKWEAFGWHVTEVDGHDHRAIGAALEAAHGDRPLALIARTTFGKGVSFMERQLKWHYWPMSDEEFARALGEVEGA